MFPQLINKYFKIDFLKTSKLFSTCNLMNRILKI